MVTRLHHSDSKKLKQKYKAKHLKVPCDCGHKSAGYPEEVFDERKLHRGAKIEFEHTCDKEVAERIAADHITEFPVGYYEELEKRGFVGDISKKIAIWLKKLWLQKETPFWNVLLGK